jgi:hypothetical protein
LDSKFPGSPFLSSFSYLFFSAQPTPLWAIYLSRSPPRPLPFSAASPTPGLVPTHVQPSCLSPNLNPVVNLVPNPVNPATDGLSATQSRTRAHLQPTTTHRFHAVLTPLRATQAMDPCAKHGHLGLLTRTQIQRR